MFPFNFFFAGHVVASRALDLEQGFLLDLKFESLDFGFIGLLFSLAFCG